AAGGVIARVLPATVHRQVRIPESHASARILGAERMGSGTVVDAAGLILTVNYVVLGAEQVRVTLLDQRAYVAEVVRHDYASGLALVRIPEDHLSALPLRRTTDLVPGEAASIVARAGVHHARLARHLLLRREGPRRDRRAPPRRARRAGGPEGGRRHPRRRRPGRGRPPLALPAPLDPPPRRVGHAQDLPRAGDAHR